MYEFNVEQLAEEIIRVVGEVDDLNYKVSKYDREIAIGVIAREKRKEAWKRLNTLQLELSELQGQLNQAELKELVFQMPSIHLLQLSKGGMK